MSGTVLRTRQRAMKDVERASMSSMKLIQVGAKSSFTVVSIQTQFTLALLFIIASYIIFHMNYKPIFSVPCILLNVYFLKILGS